MSNVRTVFDPVNIHDKLHRKRDIERAKKAMGSFTDTERYPVVEHFDYNQNKWVISNLDQYLTSQEFADSMPEDGIISSAYRVKTHATHQKMVDGKIQDVVTWNPYYIGTRPSPSYVAPATAQYMEGQFLDSASRKLEGMSQIRVNSEEIEGYVQAHYDADADSANEQELAMFNLGHRDDRLVYLVLSGMALMMWRSKEDYMLGKYNTRGAPRALAWFDMKKAFDIAVQKGDAELDHCPHRIAVQVSSGVVFFRVPEGEDVELWYYGIRGCIRDFNYAWINSRDTVHHQEKRWPCAIGLARQLRSGSPVGDRAMAIAFHCYDIDYDCKMRIGEIMILILEVKSAMWFLTGMQECSERDLAVEYAMCNLSPINSKEDGLNQIFERAMTFRNNCDANGNGDVAKDEFMRLGHAELCIAMDQSNSSDGRVGRQGDTCNFM
jgi:hypothetical protein